MTADLVQFLRDRLDEDAIVAQKAIAEEFLTSGRWMARGPYGEGDRFGNIQSEQNEQIVEESLLWQTATHIVRHDPARVLAEVEWKQRIVSNYAALLQTFGSVDWAKGKNDPVLSGTLSARETLHSVLRAMATAYADHPDYREEWKL